jgi:glycosyl transferase family 87
MPEITARTGEATAAAEIREAKESCGKQSPRLLPIFAAWRLQAYGYGIVVIYVVVLIHLYSIGGWILDNGGSPLYIDFVCSWVAGLQALHGDVVSIYTPAEFLKVQDAVVGSGHSVYPYWPYPPSFFLLLAPLSMLPYVAAFLTWNLLTLVGYVVAIYLVVRRSAAIPLALASPFVPWNLVGGQNGLLLAALFGMSLCLLERRPMLAGAMIGCLTYKPQFGILLPVALAASNNWRAFASAAVTAMLLAVASAAAFGPEVWEAFPRALVDQARGILLHNPENLPISYWGHLQTVYGVVRTLHGGAASAWLAQGIATVAAGAVLWVVWRSRVRYALKAALLPAAALLATPYAHPHDMAIVAVSLAFLAADQMAFGLLRGEQTAMLSLFAMSLAIIISFGGTPLGPLMTVILLGIILRRALSVPENHELRLAAT